jgi:hypothetical protein
MEGGTVAKSMSDEEWKAIEPALLRVTAQLGIVAKIERFQILGTRRGTDRWVVGIWDAGHNRVANAKTCRKASRARTARAFWNALENGKQKEERLGREAKVEQESFERVQVEQARDNGPDSPTPTPTPPPTASPAPPPDPNEAL